MLSILPGQVVPDLFSISTSENFMKKFVVSIKDDSGEYVPHGVMSFRAAMTLQFSTGRTVYLEAIPEGGPHGK